MDIEIIAYLHKKRNLAFKLALFEILIDFSYFDRGLSLAIDRITLALEGGGDG